MGRSPCCDKVGLKKGPWTPEEDQMLLAYIEEHGHGSWRALPSKAGLQRCGKSCRLRWTNYLRPDIKRGKFSLQEEQTIIQLHALLGNRWSAIATHLQKRTDNEIKNYWNTHLKKRLTKMGIDPVTHKPKNDALLTTQAGSNYSSSKSAANLSHMAQWESARLEAEARLVRQSKLRSHPLLATSAAAAQLATRSTSIKSWSASSSINVHVDLESPTSTLSTTTAALPGNPISSSDRHEDDRSPSIPHMFEFIKDVSHHQHDDASDDWTVCQLAADHHSAINDHHHNHIAVASGGTISCCSSMEAGGWTLNNKESSNGDDDVAEEGFISLLLCDSTAAAAGGDHQEHGSSSEVNNNSEISGGGGNEKNSNKDSSENNSGSTMTTTNEHEHEYCEDKNYWNSILNLVDTSSPSPDGDDTHMF
ncbi:unnamed protein product [Linum tenue]|uniref:Uncharacterized protein n=1 Tax=Linum tenue TaxID=586396 RepID=A0AAV0HUH4_9ROSI|nr:unnamed protein product [Linum tenue]